MARQACRVGSEAAWDACYGHVAWAQALPCCANMVRRCARMPLAAAGQLQHLVPSAVRMGCRHHADDHSASHELCLCCLVKIELAWHLPLRPLLLSGT